MSVETILLLVIIVMLGVGAFVVGHWKLYQAENQIKAWTDSYNRDALQKLMERHEAAVERGESP